MSSLVQTCVLLFGWWARRLWDDKSYDQRSLGGPLALEAKGRGSLTTPLSSNPAISWLVFELINALWQWHMVLLKGRHRFGKLRLS